MHPIKIMAVVLAVWVCLAGCHTSTRQNNGAADSLSIRQGMGEAPQLSPAEAISRMKVEEGFAVKLVAAEPLIAAPVAMSWDKQGRLWVVCMQDYMPDTLGTGEDEPGGKIVILTDTNGDGVMDSSRTFLDSLVLPRAICLIENGILVAEPPKLWHYDIRNDKPVHKTLIDADYAAGGNVEHQPNGLLRAMDNWIYSAKSDKRYRKKGSQWICERTHFRGQWGISQDEQGCLFYNTNSENLLGDYFSPGLGAANRNQKSVAGFVTKIVADNRVYPIHPTPGVNRGYMEGVLDDSLRLADFTAACGPLVYLGAAFGNAYQGNAFVAEPAANLIKRNIVKRNGFVTAGQQAYQNREFLASTDERFRPVNLSDGPDGALYVVDMYRGIIQHKTYLTPYLKNEIRLRALTRPLHCGRIYKIVRKNQPSNPVPLIGNTDSLVALLRHPNGWVRRAAQQQIIDKKDTAAPAALRAFWQRTGEAVPLVHALWTLEGLQALQATDLLPLLQHPNPQLKEQALAALPSVISQRNYRLLAAQLTKMAELQDTLVAPYLAFAAHSLMPYSKSDANKLLLKLAAYHPDNVFVADAIISSLPNKEALFYKQLQQQLPDTSLVIYHRFSKLFEEVAAARNAANRERLTSLYPKGAAIFQTVCQTCHGADGNGVTALAPPLNGSEWVQGDKQKLIRIVLYGLSGPVKVGNKLYEAPEISGEMPGIGANTDYTDDDIAQTLNFIRHAWNNKGDAVSAGDIRAVRTLCKDRQKAFTMEELNAIP